MGMKIDVSSLTVESFVTQPGLPDDGLFASRQCLQPTREPTCDPDDTTTGWDETLPLTCMNP